MKQFLFRFSTVLLACAMLISGNAFATSISACGTFVASGTYTLSQDIRTSGGGHGTDACLRDGGDGVIFDLNGHSVIDDDGSIIAGVWFSFAGNTVKNGKIQGFNEGIHLDGAEDESAANSRITNISICNSTSSSMLFDCPNHVVVSNFSIANTSAGIVSDSSDGFGTFNTIANGTINATTYGIQITDAGAPATTASNLFTGLKITTPGGTDFSEDGGQKNNITYSNFTGFNSGVHLVEINNAANKVVFDHNLVNTSSGDVEFGFSNNINTTISNSKIVCVQYPSGACSNDGFDMTGDETGSLLFNDTISAYVGFQADSAGYLTMNNVTILTDHEGIINSAGSGHLTLTNSYIDSNDDNCVRPTSDSTFINDTMLCGDIGIQPSGGGDIFINVSLSTWQSYAFYTASDDNFTNCSFTTSDPAHGASFVAGGDNVFIGTKFGNTAGKNAVEVDGTGNLFYDDNFSTSLSGNASGGGFYVNDTAGGNFYNSSTEGNIWGNVMNGSVAIYGVNNSSAFPGLFVGYFGSGYPYKTSTSQGKVVGNVTDYHPLTSYTSTLTVNSTSGGTATGNASDFTTPSNHSISATALANYTFANWTKTSGNCTISNSTSNATTVQVNDPAPCNVQANFTELPNGNLAVNYTVGGTATGNATHLHFPASAPVNAIPSAGYAFSAWNLTGNCTIANSSANSTNVSMLSGNCNAQASFNLVSVPQISIANSANGLNTTSANISFSWIAVDAYSPSLSCSLFINGVLNMSGIAANNSTIATTYANSSSNLSYGSYNWSISCTDSLGGTNYSANYTFHITPTVVSGNASAINTTLSNVAASINGTNVSDGTALNTTLPVSIFSNGSTILSFSFNFSNSSLNFSQISINNSTVGDKAFFTVSGIPSGALIGGKNITIYGASTAYGYVCVKDEDNVTNITSDCSGATETAVSCDGATHSGYTCAFNGTTLTITGLNHSGVEQYQPPAAVFTGGSGGSSGTAVSLSESSGCPGSTLEITARSSGGVPSGIEVQLYVRGTRNYVSSTTDSQGVAYFTVPSGEYYAESVRKLPYAAGSLGDFSATSCVPSQPAQPQQPQTPQQPASNQTQPSQPSQLNVNSTSPAANQTQAPSQPVANQSNGTAATQPAQKPSTSSLPVEVPQATPEVKQAVAANALPGIVVLGIGMFVLVLAGAVAFYVLRMRKK